MEGTASTKAGGRLELGNLVFQKNKKKAKCGQKRPVKGIQRIWAWS